jgi:hypothetical protein
MVIVSEEEGGMEERDSPMVSLLVEGHVECMQWGRYASFGGARDRLWGKSDRKTT